MQAPEVKSASLEVKSASSSEVDAHISNGIRPVALRTAIAGP